MKRTLATFLLLSIIALPLFSFNSSNNKEGDFYQITIYHFTSIEQQNTIEQYLKDAYLPALRRQQIKNIGVFTALSNDTATDKRIYLFFPVKSLKQFSEITSSLTKDDEYIGSGAAYLDASYKTPPYSRMELVLLKAFPLAPFFTMPGLKGPKAERVYELRSYESATEKIFQNKVKMFNEGGEIGLFKQLGFNAVFYGSVIAGSHMPNLMYMTCFENKADRDEHWKSFGASPVWKKLSALPEYQNNVSKNDQVFLRATAYSDF